MGKAIGSRFAAAALAVLVGGGVPAKALSAEAQGDASPLADDATLVALAVALACADAPQAIAAPPAAPPGVSDAGPALELVATVNAKSLTFQEVPKVNVVFNGNGPRRTVWKTERVNLPAHPEPGVAYKDVQVRLTVTSDIDELSALLNEAKRASRGIRIEHADAVPAASPAAPSAAPSAPSAPVSAAAPAAPVAVPAPAAKKP